MNAVEEATGQQAGQQKGAAGRPAAFVFIFATVLLDMLSLGIVIPVLLALMSRHVGAQEQGPPAGRQRQYRGHRQSARPGAVHRDVCVRHRRRPRLAPAGRGIFGLGAAAFRVHHRGVARDALKSAQAGGMNSRIFAA